MTSDNNSQHNNPDNCFKKALTLTITDDYFNAEATEKLAETLEEVNANQELQTEDIKNILLETLYDGNLSNKHIDFYPNEDGISSFSRSAITDTADWENNLNNKNTIDDDSINQRLESNSVPGRYKVLGLLGSGASGQVFAVRDNNLERIIAVKFMHPKDIKHIEKIKYFIDEACTTAQLNHPNIINVHDIDYTDGAIPYFTMRKAKGLTLFEILQNPNKNIDSFNKRAAIAIRICETIAFAHSKGIVHNDIKPSNIMIGDYGEITILDWGTSTNKEQRNDPDQKFLGTPLYMAPEQARKELSDELSDVYGIGSTLFHLLTFRPPLYTEDLRIFWELKKSGFYQDFSALEQRNIPGPLIAITIKAIRECRSERYDSVLSLRNDLINFQNGTKVSVYNDSPYRVFCRIIKRNRKSFLAAGIFSTLTLIMLFMIYLEKLKEYSSWSIVYQQDFNSYEQIDLIHEWKSTEYPNWNFSTVQENNLLDEPGWILKDNCLQSFNNSTMRQGIRNITSNLKYSGNLKVSWDISSAADARDFNAYISGEDRFHSYMFHIGGFGDPRKVELSKYESVMQIDIGYLDQPLNKGQTYNICMEKENSHVRLYVDNKLIIDYIDPIPLVGPMHETFGFEHNGNQYKIDNIQVWHKPLPEKTSIFTLADDLFSHDQIELALTEYSDLLERHSNSSSLSATALFRAAQCFIRLKHYNKAKSYLQQFVNHHFEHELSLNALMNLSHIAILEEQDDALLIHLEQIGKYFHANSSSRWILSKTLTYYQNKLNISNNFQLHPNAKEITINFIKFILKTENTLGVKSQRYIGYPINTCASILIALGCFEDVISLCPDCYSAPIAFAALGDFDSAIKTDFLTKELLQTLIAHNMHQEIIDNYSDKIQLFSSIHCNSSDLKQLVAYAQKQSQSTEPYDSLLLKPDGQIDLVKLHWNKLIQSGNIKSLIQSTEQTESTYIAWSRKFLYALLDDTPSLDNSESLSPEQKIDADTALAIKKYTKGDTKEADTIFKELFSYSNQYHLDYFNGNLAYALCEWTHHQDAKLFYLDISEIRDEVEHRYAGSISLALDFLAGACTETDLEKNSYFHTRSNDITLLKAIRQDIAANKLEALNLYRIYSFDLHAAPYLFSRWRISDIEKLLNE